MCNIEKVVHTEESENYQTKAHKEDTKMEYANGKVKDLQIAYIGGGSRGWAWTFMTDLAMDDELSGTIRLYDIDAEAAKHNEIIGNRLSAREDGGIDRRRFYCDLYFAGNL